MKNHRLFGRDKDLRKSAGRKKKNKGLKRELWGGGGRKKPAGGTKEKGGRHGKNRRSCEKRMHLTTDFMRLKGKNVYWEEPERPNRTKKWKEKQTKREYRKTSTG